MKELEKTYNPADIEDRLYQKWLDNKYFHADAERGRREGKKPFTIVRSSVVIMLMAMSIGTVSNLQGGGNGKQQTAVSRRRYQITKRITAINWKMLPARTHRWNTLCI